MLISHADFMKPSEVTPEWIADRLAVTGRRQGQLAAALGLDHTKMSKVMNGKRQLTPEEREKALEILLPASSSPREADTDGTGDRRFVEIPRFDIQLSGGPGTSIFESDPLDHIPFTREFLRRRLGRETPRGLVMLEARGDSMEPLISDGDLVMIDRDRHSISGTISAFRFEGEAFIKRLQRTGDGVQVISENAAYPNYTISSADLGRFTVLGQVRWIGRVL